MKDANIVLLGRQGVNKMARVLCWPDKAGYWRGMGIVGCVVVVPHTRVACNRGSNTLPERDSIPKMKCSLYALAKLLFWFDRPQASTHCCNTADSSDHHVLLKNRKALSRGQNIPFWRKFGIVHAIRQFATES